MGAWGVSGFANDTSADWSWEFENEDFEPRWRAFMAELAGKLAD